MKAFQVVIDNVEGVTLKDGKPTPTLRRVTETFIANNIADVWEATAPIRRPDSGRLLLAIGETADNVNVVQYAAPPDKEAPTKNRGTMAPAANGPVPPMSGTDDI